MSREGGTVDLKGYRVANVQLKQIAQRNNPDAFFKGNA
jgi:hypothetical protein